LLNWTRRMLTVRKRHRAFGRGQLQFLYPGNRKVLAYLRNYTSPQGESETILCVYNVARTAQAVELDLSAFAGRVPVDLIGGAAFPPVGQLTYVLTLPPYGFFWFFLATEAALPPWHIRPSEALPELNTLVIRNGLMDVLAPAARKVIETEALPAYLKRRRWFASKDQAIKSARLVRTDKIPGRSIDLLLTEVEVQLSNRTERYQLPLGIAWEGETNSALAQQLALARIRQGRRVGYLTDAFSLDALPLGLIRALRARTVLSVSEGEARCIPTSYLDAIKIPENPEIRRLSAEQSNSSLIVADLVVMKIIRRVTVGINPEVEMSRFLTENGYANTPPMLGEISRVANDGSAHTMIVAQRFVHNQGDAWQWTLDYLKRLNETMALGEKSGADQTDALANYGAFARAMGTRLAQLHAVLARPSQDPAFSPEKVTAADAKNWATATAHQITVALETLQGVKEWADEDKRDAAKFLAANQKQILAALPGLAKAAIGSLKTRIHGDFHLGQVLFASGDAYIIDFEGEPSKSLDARRAKSCPVRDVAGLLRSFHYAAATAQNNQTSTVATTGTVASAGPQAQAASQRFVDDMSAQFLEAYYAIAVGTAATDHAPLLDLFLLEKSAYEICYEAANRPTWLGIPLMGFSQIAARVLNPAPETVDA